MDEAYPSCAVVSEDHFFDVLESCVVSVYNEAHGDKMCARICFEEKRLHGFKKAGL